MTCATVMLSRLLHTAFSSRERASFGVGRDRFHTWICEADMGGHFRSCNHRVHGVRDT